MTAKDNVEKVLKSFIELKERNVTTPIVVEGTKDEKALRKMGFLGTVLKFHSRMTIEEFSHKVSLSHKEVILLLDWDSKGKRLTSTLSRHLATYGTKADLDFWKLCFSVASLMSTVESLPSVFYRLASESEAYRHI